MKREINKEIKRNRIVIAILLAINIYLLGLYNITDNKYLKTLQRYDSQEYNRIIEMRK